MRSSLILVACLGAFPVAAQEDDRDYLTAFLEDTLSDAGRQVVVTGFQGALSSRASIERLTIADDQGIWLTLEGVVLDWSRSSLLSGALEVEELSAQEITLDRLPSTPDDGLPAPEAQGFSLPDLPVSINIDRLAADRISLGPEVLGEAVVGRLDASLSLAGGEGQAALELVRIESPTGGKVTLEASYANATRALQLAINATEDPNGIVVQLLDVPGAPSADLSVQGSGTLDDFRAELGLATDGEARLQGTVDLRADDLDGQRLAASLQGNLAPILAPDLIGFFGDAVALDLEARRQASGQVSIDRFNLEARALNLSGRAEIAPDGLPELVDFTGTLAAPDGVPVLLPFGEEPIRTDRAEFRLVSEQGDQDSWSGSLSVFGLDHPGFAAGLLQLDGSGRIGRSAAGPSLGGTFRMTGRDLRPTDPDIADALGSELDGGFKLHFQDGMQALRLSDLSLAGPGLAVTGALDIAGLDRALLTSGTLKLSSPDLSRFSGLAGRPISGSGEVTVSGSASRLSGFFDTDIAVRATGLGLGVAELDRLLARDSTLDASVRRDETGTTLRSFSLAAGPLLATASGKLSSQGSSISGQLELADLSALGPGYGGALDLSGSFDGTLETGRAKIAGTARSLRTGNAPLDKLLAGQSQLSLLLVTDKGSLGLEDGRLENPQLRVSASGRMQGAARDLTLDARLGNLALLAPGFEGPLTLRGTATQDGNGTTIDLAGSGPGQVNATIKGRLTNDFRAQGLTIRGTARAELANLFLAPRAVSGPLGFDLAMNGPLSLAALGGRITLSDGRVTDPDLGLSLTQVEAIGQITAGTVRVAATSALSSGGRLRIDGPVGLSGPNQADLRLTLEALRLYDPDLYDTRVSGNLTLTGPLSAGARLAGRLQLSETELRVPASGFAASGALAEIRHRNEPTDVRETRRRAGLFGEGAAGGSGQSAVRPVALDLVISAPSRVFLRGRGIDAELGGELRLAGTTANVVPSGGFNLIRGRIDILGKRLVLSRADLSLEGSLVPEIAVAATVDAGEVLASVTVEGPADDPRVSFTSTPDLPQEEVLARLLFGRGLQNISPFQAAQLAGAVATLAGRGGEGLIGKLRRETGLDDLDVTVGEDGSASLKAGKYIAENAYTEVEVDQDGRSRINLNLDLRDGVTVKGRLGADGETGIGVFIERDY